MEFFLSDMTYWRRVERLNELRRRAEAADTDLYDALREHSTITGQELRFGTCTRANPVVMDYDHFGAGQQLEGEVVR